MEKDFRLAPKKFWLTVQQLRKGRRNPINMVCSMGGEMLTSAEFIVWQWKE